MGQRWFFFFPSIEDELFALPRSTSTRYILRVVETAIPFPVTRGRRTTIIRKFVSRSCIWNEGKLGGEQFEKNYRSPRGSRETLATNWLRGYPRATILCTCSPLLRRRNFVKSPASGSRELLRIMRTTSLSLSLETFVNFEPFPIVSTPPCDQNLKRRVSVGQLKSARKKVGIQWNYSPRKKGQYGIFLPLR